MLGRIWRWLTGNQKVEITVKLQIEDLAKLIEVLPGSTTKPVIIDPNQPNAPPTQEAALDTNKPVRTERKKLMDDPVTSDEVASIMLSGGIERATDKTGSDVVSASEGGSTDDTVSSLKQFLGGKKKNV